MTEIDKKTDAIASQAHSDLPSPQLPFPMDCSAFLNWTESWFESESERAVVFRSLVATLKVQPALDMSQEAKAVKLLGSASTMNQDSIDDFLCNFATILDDSSTAFIHSIMMLISSPSHVITTAAMKMLDTLIQYCSENVRLALVKADLLPRLINTLNPQSLSFEEAEDIHTSVMIIIWNTLWLATSESLDHLEIEDENEQQAVHKTVYQQVLAPSEQHIRHFCVNRFSIIDGSQSTIFLALLATILEICPYYQPTMEFVLHIPVFLTIPCCLTFFEIDHSISNFLYFVNNAQWEWNEQREEVREMGITVLRMLRMEGIEEVIEEKLQNDRNEMFGRLIIRRSIEWKIHWNNSCGSTVSTMATKSTCVLLTSRMVWDSMRDRSDWQES
ncbi:hypothetical protein BLNAU_9090 [Blattamonas nauphoetae]|uniref:Uncharacterized protein n=1 Tax=Blattamonas nauphoetae TaxID=2049346 RepID=A0ABQ9XWT0_9EUKA|nr:hypothetical protein BLNAU_9090 [Blattamonas nauphoetae]